MRKYLLLLINLAALQRCRSARILDDLSPLN